jgi:hypothetical protein
MTLRSNRDSFPSVTRDVSLLLQSAHSVFTLYTGSVLCHPPALIGGASEEILAASENVHM